MKVVIDTNIFISFLIGKSFLKLKNIFFDMEIKIFSSMQQLNEIEGVLDRKKFAKYFNDIEKEEFVSLFLERVEFVEPKNKVAVCRDIKDNFLLEIALCSNADFLITGDNDLLVLNPFNNTQIISYTEFLHCRF